MPYGTVNADLITGSTGGTMSPASTFGFKSRIINGAMVIDQRNAGASVTPTLDGQYGSCDRWSYWLSQSSKFSVQQVATTPTSGGFTNSLLATSLSAYAVGTNDYFSINQKIEGYNVSDLGWGTANAKTVTLSFWVASSISGTFGGAITNSANTRSYPFTYTISTPSTFQLISVTIAGDTSGTWLTTNGTGLIVQFSLGAGTGKSGTAGTWAGSWLVSATGATSVVGTSGATFYITGVQLEVGTNATSFDYRPYGTELALCQRYFEITNTAQISGSPAASSVVFFNASFVVTKRTSPSNYGNGGTISFYQASNNTQYAGGSVGAINNVSVGGVEFQVAGFTGLTTGSYGIFRPSTSQLSWSAEL